MSNLPTTTKAGQPAQNAIKPSALQAMAQRLNVDAAKLINTLKATVFKGASDEELMALTVVANEYDLNPFLKEIYAFPAKGGGIVPIVSVDGWNKMLIRQPSFDGIEFSFEDGQDGNPYSCTATIHIKGRSKPVVLTEFFSECFRSTDPWKNMPRRMLRNRTLCQASRMAFGFSGVTNDDEAATYIDVSPAPFPTEPPPKMVALPPREVEESPQSKVEKIYLAAGFTGSDVVQFLIASGMYPEADTMIEPPENQVNINALPKEIAVRILKAEKGFLKGLSEIKSQMPQ